MRVQNKAQTIISILSVRKRRKERKEIKEGGRLQEPIKSLTKSIWVDSKAWCHSLDGSCLILLGKVSVFLSSLVALSEDSIFTFSGSDALTHPWDINVSSPSMECEHPSLRFENYHLTLVRLTESLYGRLSNKIDILLPHETSQSNGFQPS